MNLAMMRDLDRADPIGGLGPRVTPAPTPAPEPVKRPDGFVEGPDGKLSTSLPPPAVPRRGPWPFPTPASVASSPAAQPFFDVLRQAAEKVADAEPEPGAHGFMREPLKVGDKVRYMSGTLIVVDGIHGRYALGGEIMFLLSNEGKTWERVE